jgi:hypothetical protein
MRDQEFLDDLEAQLVMASRRRHELRSPRSRRRPTGLLVAAAACVAALVVGIALVDDDPAAAAVDVTIDDTAITLRLRGDDVDPDAVIEAAAEADLDVEVIELPVGTSHVGQFVSISNSELPPEMRLLDEDGQGFSGFKLPLGWPGQVRLALGREAMPGERYAAATDATAAGEPLECEPIVGAELSTSVADLRARGFTVRAFAMPTPGDVTDQLEQYGDWLVVQAQAVAADEIYLNATPDGSWPFPQGGPADTSEC